jgi:hypothetical protein
MMLRLMLLPILSLVTACASTPVPTTKVVPCTSLLIVRPTNAEIDMMTDFTAGHILANNAVIEVACK